jgi:SET domain-containing protein
MSDSIKESRHERKMRFHGEAPFAKHDYRYRSRDVIRMAGQVWAESGVERQQRLRRERNFEKMKHTPLGLGFSNRDNYGPDDTYKSVEYLSSTPDPTDYID